MADPNWTSLLPPLLAIVLAVWTRQVFVALGAGIWLGGCILSGGHPLVGAQVAIELIVKVLEDGDNARVVLFTFVIGALIGTVESCGGVKGFINWIDNSGWMTSPRRAQLLVWLTGVLIFIESNITILVAGALARPLFDRFKISRERLAYLIDSTAAPVCMIIPLNAWGAYNIGILATLGVENPLQLFLQTIPLNFYALTATGLALVTAVTSLNLGPMGKAEERTQNGEVLWPGAQPMMDETMFVPMPEGNRPRAINMLLPMLVMIVMMPAGLYLTGGGDFREGSGSTSVLWAVLAGLAMAWLLLLSQRVANLDELSRTALRGAQGMMPMALIILLALALGKMTRDLGTGAFVAGIAANSLSPAVFLPVVFLVASAIAFSTGTSWGTFAIMLPVAVPAASAMGLPLAPFVAASLSGGIFGDHASPISDTTIMASMAAATDHIDHVRTQMPYALIAGGLALVGFLIVGLTL
ncbi:MAG: Na+/H+ antiporter NhaC family protein [Vulcanimicrobiota bacterium]